MAVMLSFVVSMVRVFLTHTDFLVSQTNSGARGDQGQAKFWLLALCQVRMGDIMYSKEIQMNMTGLCLQGILSLLILLIIENIYEALTLGQ